MSLNTLSSVTEPRQAHQLNDETLYSYLQQSLPALRGVAGHLVVKQFQHGQSNPTFLLELGNLRMVLRKQPPGKLLASAHAVDREFRVLSALASTAVPVPKPLLMCHDRAVLGTPFYVMEFANGTIFTDPNLLEAGPRDRTRIYTRLADTLADLHNLSPAELGLQDFGNPGNYCKRQVSRWSKQYLASVPQPMPQVMQLISWLQSNVPAEDAAPAAAAVVHGDYRLDNLVFDDQLQVSAVLDWELATVGNAWADVAYLCLPYHLPPALPSLRLQQPLPGGIPPEGKLLQRYCSSRGLQLPAARDWAFYLAMSVFRLLSILAGVQARARQGNASSARADAISSDVVLAALAQAALDIVAKADAGSEFMAHEVFPNEEIFEAHASGPDRWTIHPLNEKLKAKARTAGLWNLWMPAGMAAGLQHLLPEVPEAERTTLLGAGLSHLDYAHLCAVMGSSLWAPELFNCSAPDTGNMEVLAKYGTRDQQLTWLLPLLRAMDPRCKVAIFMGKTDPTAPTHKQQSMLLVPMDAPGVKVVRPLSVFGYDDAPHGHAEVSFSNVVVPTSNLLLGEGRGFEIAQGRLGPGRLHHCMRLVGMAERALHLAATRSLQRSAFGRPLAAQGGLREVLARQRVALEGTRLLVLNAAEALDRVGHKAARGEIAAAKVAAPAVALQVIDAAIQIHGGAGVSQDVVLGHLWACARTLRIADGPDEVHLGTLAKLELEAAAGAPAALKKIMAAGGGSSRSSDIARPRF
eukprot:gene10196-10357_t